MRNLSSEATFLESELQLNSLTTKNSRLKWLVALDKSWGEPGNQLNFALRGIICLS